MSANPFPVTNRTFDRSTKLSLDGQIAAMEAQLANVAAAPLKQPVDAVITMQGLGEHFRVANAIEQWIEGGNPQALLIIAGSSKAPDQLKSFVEMTPDNLVQVFGLPEVYLDQIGTRIIIQPHAVNTPDQTNWVARELYRHEVRVATHAVTWYHELRNYGSLLASQQRVGTLGQTLVVPRMLSVSPLDRSPHTDTPYSEMHSGEITRMLKYIPEGSVLGHDDLMDYFLGLYEAGVI